MANSTNKSQFALQRDYLLAAVMFYTRIPVPAGQPHSSQILNFSRIYFPVIGWLVGAIGTFVYVLSLLFLPISIAVLLSMVATVLVTGAFHEDGFADSCDGFGGGWTTKQVLTIMKDSRVGTYATVGLLLLLGTKFIALFELAKMTQENLLLFALIYLCGHTFSRLLASIVIDRYDYVQDIDVSKVKPITDKRLSLEALLFTVVLGLLPIAYLLLKNLSALYAVLFAALAGLLFIRYSVRRIGGYTGDVLGGVQQISEVIFYIAIYPVLI